MLDQTTLPHMTREETIAMLKWHRFQVLDRGWVCLVDVMGDDAAVAQAARTSYGEGTKKVSDDKTLIRYLMRHRHSTPFEMCELKFMVRVPMDCWRQWIRHRTASVNEYSTRYSEAIDEMQRTDPEQWRTQATNNRQGSGDYLPACNLPGELSIPDGTHFSTRERAFQEMAFDVYRERVDNGVAREQARKDLPLSTYTLAYWKLNLHNLLHFLGLRMDGHAQLEIRTYATTIGERIVANLFPEVWSAFLDYRMNSMQLSALDIAVVRELRKSTILGDLNMEIVSPDSMVWPAAWRGYARHREREECIAKLERLGLIPTGL